jgi:hypothetical protein
MPYCPNCKFEYQSGVTQCPDCGTVLIEQMPAPCPEPRRRYVEAAPDPGTEPTELCRVGDPSEADIIRATLAEAGIDSFLKIHGPLAAIRVTVVDGTTSEYAIVYVARNRLPEAQRVLAEARSRPPEWPLGMEPDLESEEDD